MEIVTEQNTSSHFILSNTQIATLPFLEEETIIPAFAKDNESTISHVELIEALQEAAEIVFRGVQSKPPKIKVSHPIKGRIPEAKGKPAKDLLDHEKTLYFERMAFMIDLPEISGNVEGNKLSLTVGGVRAYNQENLYNKKSPEKFKLFIGYKNWVCTNLCVSTDGFLSEVKVQSINELQQHAVELFSAYNQEQELSALSGLSDYGLTAKQFSYFIGRAKQYLALSKDEVESIPFFPLGESQLTSMVKEYYAVHGADSDISLWQLYNLMTSANKSSYIDSFLNRGVECLGLSKSLLNAIKSNTPHWYTINL